MDLSLPVIVIAMMIVLCLAAFSPPRVSPRSGAAVLATGSRLAIRPVVRSDAKALGEINTEENLRPNGLLDDEGQLVSNASAEPEQISLAVIEAETGELVAATGFRPANRDHESEVAMEFSIMVRANLHGTGIGFEATALSIGWMLNRGCERVIAGCDSENVPMRSILEKLADRQYHECPLELPNGSIVNSVWFEFAERSRPTARINSKLHQN